MRWNLYRTNCRGVGGLVDYLGEVNAPNYTAAEQKGRELFDFSESECIDVQEVCVTCNGLGHVTDDLEARETKCANCDGSGEL